MGDYQLAATELALLHRKAERGVISRRQFSQGQQGLLTLMQQARGQFLRRQPAPPPTPWTEAGASADTSAFTQPMAYRATVPTPVMPQTTPGASPWARPRGGSTPRGPER
jgi:hypothetical protein